MTNRAEPLITALKQAVEATTPRITWDDIKEVYDRLHYLDRDLLRELLIQKGLYFDEGQLRPAGKSHPGYVAKLSKIIDKAVKRKRFPEQVNNG